ncbi:hypothetical protein DSO57_1016369 [Entomophthora muscae]|uniref:Uncharacterized protein n=1 Tax=Entomophthora muscae TaxID=34485 RepID=A0ACC2UQZ9_9FUNG|nr:hypothetical protein DSO57_1016369 [Entomophthora muscae]
MGNDLSKLLQLPTSLLISGEALVKSLSYNDLDLYSSDHTLLAPLSEEVPTTSLPLLDNNDYVPLPTVNSLPPLALNCTIFPCRTKKSPKIPAKPLNSLGDLEHTVDERFLLAYPTDLLALAAPWEEMLINLDYLLAWCLPLLKTIRNN